MHLFYVSASWILLLCTRFGTASESFEASAELPDGKVTDLDMCPQGTYFSNLRCLECPSGHFCLGNVSAPRRCPTGTFNLYTGRSDMSDCKPCFPGLISSEDRVNCRLCPAGFTCDKSSGILSLCSPGQHSPEGLLQCLPCPIDSVCASGFPLKCGPGKEPNLDHTECDECPPGFFSNMCTVQCLQCPAGNYCPSRGMSQPLTCPPGWSSTLGQTHCSVCNATTSPCVGSSALGSSQSVHRLSQPFSCRSGTYETSSGDLACAVCPRGYYCVGGIAVPCPAGTYGSTEGLQRLRDCTICPSGFYCLEGSSGKPTSEFLCPQGYYCDEGTAALHGSPCPAGTAGEQLGQTSRAACKRCKEGRFCPPGSSSPGLPCARGRYCPAGTLEETLCPKGTFTPHQGAISVKDCLKCPSGFYCPEGTSDPVPCPAGTFSSLEGQDELTDCRACHAGKACTQVALRAPDVDCMQGFVCPPGSSKPNVPTNACPPGTLSDRTDLTDRSQCQLCPARYACLRGTGGIQRPPLSCFSGHYCPPGTKFPTQYKCPAGTWSAQSGLESDSECQPCPAGWYCLVGSGAPSGRCSTGHFCPEGTAYGTQFPCPAGTYSVHMGNKKKEDCLLCPGGSFCQEGTSKPAPCPPSTFRHLKGGQRLEDCSVCPAGYFCSHSATVNPRACGAGSYSDEGSVDCSPCLPGHYCSNETTSEEAMLSVMVCPPGFLCSQGLDRDPQRLATLCPQGFYCPGGGIDPNPIPCPNGTYSDFPSLRDISECVRCPAGEYCYSQRPNEQPITRPTGICPDGHYCPPGTGYPYTYPCQAGHYRNTTAGHSGEECVLCPPGLFCDGPGVQQPSVCPQGFYCPVGSASPTPCPEGTYSSRSSLSQKSQCSPCDGGRYCNGVGLTQPSGNCKERFYCRKGAKSPTPVDGPAGGLCPAGSFCPEASASPFPCPPGTFSNSTGLSRTQDCVSCPPGFYCLGSNNTSPSGPCSPGYYCTGGSASPVQYIAKEGHYSLEGAVREEPCPLGTFQSLQGAQSCAECQGGRLCDQTGMSLPPPCLKGHYCPPGTTAAQPCPPGSYSDQPGGDSVQHCRPCEAGWFCGRAGLSHPQGLCDPGHYCTSGASSSSPVALSAGGVCPVGFVCPQGTKYPEQYPCPVGTWSNTLGNQNLSLCKLCPPGFFCNTTGLSQPSGLCQAGFYCSKGSVSSRPSDRLTGDICPVGHHCPIGSSSPTVCPDGTYTNSTGAESCDACPSGTYCLSGEGIQPCPAGHYCLGGGVEGILPCPPGTYSHLFGLSQVEQCLICPAGFYCEDWGLFEPTGSCQAGYYCLAGINIGNPDGNFSTGVGGACPQGNYCPEGTSVPLPCPPGTFSKSLYLTDVADCSPCPAGQFCGTAGLIRPSGWCQAGFYCPGGDKAPTGSRGGICPPAHYCPERSTNPVPCPAGTYTNLTGQVLCARCPAGYYCPEKTDNFTKFPCPPGFYCPDGTRHATQFPCPRGYYNPEPMTQSLDSCLPCPPGHYCEKEMLTKVSGKCKAGWFCVSAAWNSQPFDLDNYTNANCLCPATSTGGRCQVGFYCPSGSSEPLPCPPGAFCNISGLALPMGPCSPGYFCVGGAAEARPADGKTGNICPRGTYCAEGSGAPELCPAGTFSPVLGLTSEAGCQPCTAGFYCSGVGLKTPSGPCSQGYWCPAGQAVATALPCPPSHFCPEGSAAPEPCPSGTYQDREKQAACDVCEAGYYCDLSYGLTNRSLLQPCPAGYYCPVGTNVADRHPCPIGSFNPRQHSVSQESCMPCTVGQYCSAAGLSAPTGPCHAGYWCRTGASSPSPMDDFSGSLCPPGHYCSSGIIAPVACPEGSWSRSSGLRSREDCKSCPGGYYCDSAGLTAPTGRCGEGYFCLEGAVTSTPTDGVTGGPCPEGYHCPEGSVRPVPCDPGTYVAVTHAAQCERCIPGWYCVNGSLHLCPSGFYCPEGTGYDMRSCPVGTYGPDPGYWSVSQCRRCDGGHYCSSRNATAVTGQCHEGYYCSGGSTFSQPLSAGDGGPCPAGHFCPQATIHPLPCPPGTFSNLTKLVSQEGCQPCLPGYYCDAVGLPAPAGKCRDGFFCLWGADRPDPPFRDSRGGPCPKGYYCLEGSAAPLQCPLGTVSTEDGRASCNTCPQGFYCPDSDNGLFYECPTGHYCPFGTWSKHQHPCPAGSINPYTQMARPQDCLPCPSGSFCVSPGMTATSGQCHAGYYCLSGARSPAPLDGGMTGDRCPEGHYCPKGTSYPFPCPSGYYSNKTGNTHLSDCLPCPPGFLCVRRGLSFPSYICPNGSYCPGRENDQPQVSIPCTPGNMCPPGSHKQIPCVPGTYQPFSGQEECVKCPAGFYCAGGSRDGDSDRVSGTHTPALCPQGFYCPPGTQSGLAFPCPAGTLSRQMGLSNKSGCEPCPPGTYCGSSGQTAPTGLCSPGYFCVLGSVSAQPENGPTGGRCSSGFFCPRGTGYMVPCPAGTFGSRDGAMAVTDCQLCLPGYYCAEIGLSLPTGPCSAGFYCAEGSTTATPSGNFTDTTSPSLLTGDLILDKFRGDVCPAGHYCPTGSKTPIPCPPGTFLQRSGTGSETECEVCRPGFYCPLWAQTSVDHPCPLGWFCPAGSVSGHQPGRQCPPGHACPYGSAEPTICSPGTFQSSSGQSTCNTCSPGFYCSEGSALPSPCPMGFVSPLPGRASLSDCLPCPLGHFCNSSALAEPSGPCSPGYFCFLGSTEPSPVSKPHGDICPAGHFCPVGSGSPNPCPVGSFLPKPGASSSSHCRLCPPGKYCSSPGASQPMGPCSAGFFCTGGADGPAPRAGPSLFRCLYDLLEVDAAKTDAMSRMHNLSYFDNCSHFGGGADWIKVVMVPEAHSEDMVTHSPQQPTKHNYTCTSYRGDICPKGFYCLTGSAYPHPCEAGFYCNQTGLDAPSGPCAAGYYCPRGSVNRYATPCATGHYCPIGTPLPLPCPLGTMKSSPGGSTVEACQLCPPGHYCHQKGITKPSGRCEEGYYCPEGQSFERPPQYVCMAGHYCEKGSVTQTACPPGSHQLRQGQGSCEQCPPGYYCPNQGMALPLPCERGFYCPGASARQSPCPAGTYGNATNLAEESQCTRCDPGMYCKGTGRTSPSGPCAAGAVCVEGASEPSPAGSLSGFPCPPGFFCPVGTFAPKPCPKGTFSERGGLVVESQCHTCRPGFYCSATGLSAVSGPCLPGFFCLEGSTTATPLSNVSGGLCPAGHFCTEGSSVPTPCPAGSFQNQTGGEKEDDCKPCPLGFFQDLAGQADCSPCPPGFHCRSQRPDPTGSVGHSGPLPCPAGYFCPGKSSENRPLPCPKGTYSPGSGLQTPGQCLLCPAGRFCGSEGLLGPSGLCHAGFLCLIGATVPNPTDNKTGSLCLPGSFCRQGVKAGDCLAGFYCDWGSSRADQAPCPAGFFCPGGTPVPIPCPAGKFSAETGNTHRDNCTGCTPGFYCPGEGTAQPTSCPAGYYCPPGMAQGLGFPCPPGTVQNQLGAFGPDACHPCPAGMFCSEPGLSQPTGNCEAGYYCPAGSTAPNSQEDQKNTTNSHPCPPGYYCPSGSGHPIPCPAGSLAIAQGLKGVEECPPCPAGYFCAQPATSKISDAHLCHAGYVCLGGSPSPTPSNGSHGYVCPAGYSCPVGSASEVPCEPGTYSPAPGAADCIICPEGTTCFSSATREPTICPAGHFCPVGTSLPQPCPLGTFSNYTGAQSLLFCMPCPSGEYCSKHGASTPQGSCLQGYFCQGGATGSTPESSGNFPRNGPCPAGHYCPAGCLSPIPCPIGSLRNTTGGFSVESCSACPAGHFCSTEGLANPSGRCAAGFYCPFDFSSTTLYAVLCPKGHYCPEASVTALPCPTGAYQPNPGSASCIPCRPGFYCEEAIDGEPRLCPPHFFCPAGTMVPQPCPDGSYTQSKEGLRDRSECLPCPPGKFCRAGRIQGVCAAGYLCASGSADFTPEGPLANVTRCQWGTKCAGPCPPGFYCPKGTEEPVSCPENSIRSSPGGASVQDCLPCPSQHWCKRGDPVLHLCPPGHYCDGLPGSDVNGSAGPRPCPLHTYRASSGAGSKGDCQPCPPGSHCNSTGLTQYSNSLCPPGYWCSGSGTPIFCPAGTKRSPPGAAALSDCEPCAAGTFCPDPRDTGIPNVAGIPCRASYYCPLGSVSERLCTAGSYCGPSTDEPQSCPEGYICPEGSDSYSNPRQLCPFPYYCPANSSTMKACKGGSMPVNTTGLRGSKSSCCSVCEGGTYRHYGSPILRCLPCLPGYFCPPGTGNYKINPCPPGYFCPSGSARPTPCPPGFFGNLTSAERFESCHLCPAGTFNPLPAQTACFPCGSSSTSLAGSSSCTCIGKNRAFQPSDGSCLCRTGFIFYNELDFKSSSSDSELDCQPEMNTRCASGQVRLAASRECVSPSLHPCNITCGSHGGTLHVKMGICQCERYVSVEELCDSSCLSKIPQLSAQLHPRGHLLLSVKEKDGPVWVKTIEDVLGPDYYADNIRKSHLVQFDPEGVFGWIPTHTELIARFISDAAPRKRRNAQDAPDDLAVLPRIPNPVACLSSGDMLLFHLTINHSDRRFSHFPVYQKDHLFNSNPSYDFGAFRRLQVLMRQTNLNSTMFAHVFTEPGKYVFVDSAVPERSMVVVVSEEGTVCGPRGSTFQPMTPAQLVRYGVVVQHRLNLLPDWGLITGILSLLLVAVLVSTATLLVLRPGKAKVGSQWRTKPKWRSLGEPLRPVECACSRERGVGEGAEAEERAVSRGGLVHELRVLEEFNVKTLYDKLEDQNLHIASQLARHRKDTQEFYRNIFHQAEALQNAFDSLDDKKLSLLKDLLVHRSDKPSNGNTGERDGQDQRTREMLSAVLGSAEVLLCRLTGEAWQGGPPRCHDAPSDARKCDLQVTSTQSGDPEMSCTQISSPNISRAGGPRHETTQLPSTYPYLSDEDFSKLVSVSPLCNTLQGIHTFLEQLNRSDPILHACGVPGHSAQDGRDAQLIPIPLDSLSPQHLTVFLFGCQVIEVLAKRPMFRPVLLSPAKSVPVSSSSLLEGLLAHCSGDFYFDATSQILYLSEVTLQHVGCFIATILHSMAFIASGLNPHRFMQALHEAISALGLQLFNCFFQFDDSKGQPGALVERLLNSRVLPGDEQFAEHVLATRLEKYKYFKLEQLIFSLTSNPAEGTETESNVSAGPPPTGTPMQMSCIEDEIDRLNESFVQLSVQLLQNDHMRAPETEKGSGAGNPSLGATSLNPPSPTRNGTMLLELKRRYISQRLNELQNTLGQIRRCQQHDGEAKDETGAHTQADSNTTLQGQRENYPGIHA